MSKPPEQLRRSGGSLHRERAIQDFASADDGVDPQNLTPDPFPLGKGNRTRREDRPFPLLTSSNRDQEPGFFAALKNDTKTLGAGLSPAEGGVEPTAGSTFNKVYSPSRSHSPPSLARGSPALFRAAVQWTFRHVEKVQFVSRGISQDSALANLNFKWGCYDRPSPSGKRRDRDTHVIHQVVHVAVAR